VVDDVDQAVTMANDSRYGLNSSVWTRDEQLGRSVAEQLQAGNVCINDAIVSYAVTGLPFGGVKESGIGRVHGPEGLREFTRTKSVVAGRIDGPRELWWFPVPQGLDSLGIRSLRLRFGGSIAAKLAGLRRSGPRPGGSSTAGG
jgi:hypothetical protein